ncbi:MAG TPA: hypothetical protein PKE19_03590 [Aestuariivirga sp.]|nr:hypothetical protein [Aestuariivirga sp.]
MRTLKDWLAAAPRDYSRMPGLERLAALEAELSAQRDRLLEQEAEADENCRAASAREVAEARDQWVRGEGETLSALIRHEMMELESRVAAAVEAVLAPFLDGEVKARAMADFAALLQRHLAEGSGLSVKGPADLLAALRHSLGDAAAMVSFSEGPGPELSTQAGTTAFVTRLEEWRMRLAGENP